jgi:anti-sigma factor RsiW
VNCKTIQRLIPDYRLADLSAKRRKIVKDHLAVCEDCRARARVWESLCNLGADACRLPAEFDWAPFDRALQEELRRTRVDDAILVRWKDFLLSNLNALANYPRKNAFRVAFFSALAVIVFSAAFHLPTRPQVQPSLGNLIIGESYQSVQGDGIVYYRGADREKTVAREEISPKTIEVIEPELQ